MAHCEVPSAQRRRRAAESPVTSVPSLAPPSRALRAPASQLPAARTVPPYRAGPRFSLPSIPLHPTLKTRKALSATRAQSFSFCAGHPGAPTEPRPRRRIIRRSLTAPPPRAQRPEPSPDFSVSSVRSALDFASPHLQAEPLVTNSQLPAPPSSLSPFPATHAQETSNKCPVLIDITRWGLRKSCVCHTCENWRFFSERICQRGPTAHKRPHKPPAPVPAWSDQLPASAGVIPSGYYLPGLAESAASLGAPRGVPPWPPSRYHQGSGRTPECPSRQPSPAAASNSSRTAKPATSNLKPTATAG